MTKQVSTTIKGYSKLPPPRGQPGEEGCIPDPTFLAEGGTPGLHAESSLSRSLGGDSPLRRSQLLANMAVLPQLGGFQNVGTSSRFLGGPLHAAHAGCCKDVLRAAPDRGCTVATILPPLGDSKPRGLGKAQHAELHLAGPHTDVRPERAEIHTKGLQHGLLYKGLHGPSTYHHCSCRSRISRKGSAGPKCCRSNFAGRRLPRTGFAKTVHGLDTAVPGCIGGGGRWQLDPGSVVHPHRA